jgi:hypothetical protein
MNCGHNGKPLDVEAALLTLHLDQAGFMPQTVEEIVSPQTLITEIRPEQVAKPVELDDIALEIPELVD